MLVVVTVVALILPAVFAIVFTILQQQAKIYSLQEVKQQGDFVLNNIRVNLKNSAISIHSAVPPTSANRVCATTGSSFSSGQLYFADKYNNYFWYSSDASSIASNSSIAGATVALTGSKVKPTSGTPLSIQCYRGATFAAPITSISYGVTFNTTSTRPEDTTSFTYNTKVQLRNY